MCQAQEAPAPILTKEVRVGWKNTKDFRGYCDRRSVRMAKQGRLLEDEVERLLKRLEEQGEIVRFKKHEPNSREDREGKDFTVVKSVEDNEFQISFGVTIALKSQRKSRLRYDHPQFCFPIGTKLETIERRILDLFKSLKAPVVH